MQRALLAVIFTGLGVACAFELPEPVDGAPASTETDGGSSSSGSSGASTSSSSSGATSSSSGTLPDAGPTTFCDTQDPAWLFCDDFERPNSINDATKWTNGIETIGTTNLITQANGILTMGIPAATTPDDRRAQVGTTVPLDDQGLRVEFDAFIQNDKPTADYEIVRAEFHQFTMIESATLNDDDGFVRITTLEPGFDSVQAPGALPHGKWIRIRFDLLPHKTNADEKVTARDRDKPSDPFALYIERVQGTYSIDSTSPRTAKIYLGVQRSTAVTPDVVVEYDNITISKRP